MSKHFNSGFKSKKEKLHLLTPFTSAIGGVKIELFSNKEAAVDGCKGVIDYYDYTVKLKTNGGAVVFNGQELTLLELGKSSAIIKGNIKSVEFL